MSARKVPARERLTLLDDTGARVSVEVDLEESPLAWLRRHRGRDGRLLIDDAQFAAGERLRSDFTFGQLTPRTTTNWAAFGEPRRASGGAGGGVELAEAVIAAQRRFARALEAVGGDLADVLVDVCCFLKGVTDVETGRKWPARSGKLVLGIALSALARHYGLSPVASGRDGQQIRRWGAPDYRPKA